MHCSTSDIRRCGLVGTPISMDVPNRDNGTTSPVTSTKSPLTVGQIIEATKVPSHSLTKGVATMDLSAFAEETAKVRVILKRWEEGRPGNVSIVGQRGLGKTTLALYLMSRGGQDLVLVDGAMITSKTGMQELAEYLGALRKRYIVFVDEVHHLSNERQSWLLPLLGEVHRLSTAPKGSRHKVLLLGQEVEASLSSWILATTEESMVFPPLLNRCFPIELKLKDDATIASILKRKGYTNELAQVASEYAGGNVRLGLDIAEALRLSGSLNPEELGFYRKGYTARDLGVLRRLCQSKSLAARSIRSLLGCDMRTTTERITKYERDGFVQVTSRGCEPTKELPKFLQSIP